ncbi:N-acetylglucosamine-6-phosphate deacetylase [Halalkalibacter alkalisediminis]|uniref:N-acetylglucosamine-6-phosphate deacetylase n=1 Tax=Halalkalibacter alkalisediminis TaxID=935616 RepID=A0ABV6NIY7_9BACI|nr:N-acetylglucosamine-6-phosphate deacetylase [Halalkalibacter alkalisediminis]
MKTNVLLITNVKIYQENTIYEKGYLKIENEEIIEIGPMELCPFDKSIEVLSFSSEHSLLPGFIDLHIHGLHGADTMDGTMTSLKKMAKALPLEGTTSFLATTITQSNENIEAALSNVAAYASTNKEQPAADILGIHLEGPFISSVRAGAQPLSFIQEPDIAVFDKWHELSGELIKLVTLAPESKNGMALLQHLTKIGVVASIGHSDAVYSEVQHAIASGLRHVTHLYNGMRGFHHREPGVAGAALTHSELMVELIADGLHVHPAIVRSTYKTKSAKEIILITDAMRAKGLEDGNYDLGGQQVHVSEGKAVLEDGTLAGSILTMNDAIKNMIAYTGCTLRDVIIMAAENPAKQIGVWSRKGSIALGKDADITILDEHLNVVMTICKGKIAYKKGE